MGLSTSEPDEMRGNTSPSRELRARDVAAVNCYTLSQHFGSTPLISIGSNRTKLSHVSMCEPEALAKAHFARRRKAHKNPNQKNISRTIRNFFLRLRIPRLAEAAAHTQNRIYI